MMNTNDEKTPIERECCGTSVSSKHRSTCPKHRETNKDKIEPGNGLSPIGLLFIQNSCSWEEVDGDLVKFSGWLSRQGELAMASAKKARKQGNLLKCRKFQSVARAYEMASDKLRDVSLPF